MDDLIKFTQEALKTSIAALDEHQAKEFASMMRFASEMQRKNPELVAAQLAMHSVLVASLQDKLSQFEGTKENLQ